MSATRPIKIVDALRFLHGRVSDLNIRHRLLYDDNGVAFIGWEVSWWTPTGGQRSVSDESLTAALCQACNEVPA